jgi:AraC-like DNA-binding protein
MVWCILAHKNKKRAAQSRSLFSSVHEPTRDTLESAQPFQGYWQTSDYGYWDDSEGTPVRRPLARAFRKRYGILPGKLRAVRKSRNYCTSLS